MADINRELEDLAELTQQVNREFAMFGQLTQDTSKKLTDAQMKAKYGFDNFTDASEKGTSAVQSLGRAAKAAGSAALEGSKKASSMNGAFDELTQAAKFAAVGLSLLIPGSALMKGVYAGITLLATTALDAANKYREVAVKISDQLYEGYSALAQSGAAASDGMTGLFEDAKKLGYSLGELAQYTQLIGENSKDLALFGGTVFEGRKQFADMGKSFEKYSGNLIAAGFTQTQINEGLMGYARLQTRLGQSQTKTSAELAEGARKYLLEMDGLAKLTGQTRKEMEAQRERQLLNEQFAAKIRELQLRGGPEAEAAAERLKAMGNMAARMGPEMEEAFLASVTGNFANAKAIGANIASQNELMKTIGMVEKNLLTPAEAMQRTAAAMGKFGDSMNGLAQVNAFESAFGIKYATVQQARLLAEGNIVKNLEKTEAERKKQGAEGGKAADAAVDAQVNFQQSIRKANEQIESFFVPGMAAATNAAALFATSAEGVAARMNKLFGITGGGGPGASAEVKDQERKKSDAEIEAAEQAKEAAFKNATMLEKIGIGRTKEQQEAAEKLNKIYEKRAQLEIDLAGGYDANGMPVAGVMQHGQEKAPVPPAPAAAPTAAPAAPKPTAAPAAPKPTAAPATAPAAPAAAKPAAPKPVAVAPAAPPPAAPAPAAAKPSAPAAAPKPAKSEPDYSAEGKMTGGGSSGSKKKSETTSVLQGSPRKTTEGIVFHHTGGSTVKSATATLKKLGLGYHYIIDRDGRVVPYTDPNSVAYHAGKTDKNPKFGNWNTLGIAAVAKDNTDVTKEQMIAAAALAKQLSGDYGFSTQNIFGHGGVSSHKMATEGQALVDAVNRGVESSMPKFGDGGIVNKETVATVGEKGAEAIIPLKNGAVPVSLNLKDALRTPTFAGYNEYAGLNQGPLTTDLDAVKKIADAAGAFDRATETITNPAMWKQILSSGLATNYQLGTATLGTKGIEGLGDDIAERLKEIREQSGSDSSAALKQVSNEFKTAMAEMGQKLSASLNTNQNENAAMARVGELLQELVSATKSGVDVQQKILATNY